MNENLCIIIPSRIGSTRLKNKPLVDIKGETLIQRVFKNAYQISTQTFVATDSILIRENLKDITDNVVMTSKDHISGTDRIHEAANTLSLNDDTLILNLQGDEPFIPKQLILNLIDDYFSLSCDVITASSNLHSDADILNPNCVLVEVDDNNYFIVTSDALRNLKRKKVLAESNNINIKIDKKSSGYWIGSEKVNNHINDFDSIR